MLRLLTIAALTLVAALACGGGTGGSNATPPQAGSSAGPSGSTVTFKETEYSISPMTQTLKAGTHTFEVQNVGQFPHDLHVAEPDGTEVWGSTVIKAGGSGEFTVTLKPGTYIIWCAVNAHRALGMQGTLDVR